MQIGQVIRDEYNIELSKEEEFINEENESINNRKINDTFPRTNIGALVVHRRFQHLQRLVAECTVLDAQGEERKGLSKALFYTTTLSKHIVKAQDGVIISQLLRKKKHDTPIIVENNNFPLSQQSITETMGYGLP